MDLIDHLITLIQEASLPAKIVYIAYIVISVICVMLFIVKAIPAIYAWITEK
jgi:hypothetical protein